MISAKERKTSHQLTFTVHQLPILFLSSQVALQVHQCFCFSVCLTSSAPHQFYIAHKFAPSSFSSQVPQVTIPASHTIGFTCLTTWGISRIVPLLSGFNIQSSAQHSLNPRRSYQHNHLRSHRCHLQLPLSFSIPTHPVYFFLFLVHHTRHHHALSLQILHTHWHPDNNRLSAVTAYLSHGAASLEVLTDFRTAAALEVLTDFRSSDEQLVWIWKRACLDTRLPLEVRGEGLLAP